MIGNVVPFTGGEAERIANAPVIQYGVTTAQKLTELSAHFASHGMMLKGAIYARQQHMNAHRPEVHHLRMDAIDALYEEMKASK